MEDNEALEMLRAKLKCMELDDMDCVKKGCDGDCDNCNLNYEKGSGGQQKEAIAVAISALERQIPKKPVMKPYYEDMEEEYLCCPTCGDILTDRIPMDNKDFYFHCLNCGQKLDWSDDN